MMSNDHAIPMRGADKVPTEQYRFLKEMCRSQPVDMITIDNLCGSEYKFSAKNSIKVIFNLEVRYLLRSTFF